MFDQDEESSVGYWPSVSDLFITLFIISIAMVAALFFVLLPKNSGSSEKQIIVATGGGLVNILTPVNRLRSELGLSALEYKSASQVIQGLGDTCDAAVSRIRELQQNFDRLKKDAKNFNPVELAKLRDEITRQKLQIEDLNKTIDELGKNLQTHADAGSDELLRENKALKRQLSENEKVIITFDDRKYSFPSGSAVISSSFSDGLKSSEFPLLAEEIERRQGQVDTLEIIGHTDGKPLSGFGNLDLKLPGFLAGDFAVFSSLRAGSNNDLGLLRALAVKLEWQKYAVAKPILKTISVRCYSAGQTILPGSDSNTDAESFRRDDPSARRIEMRLTRLGADSMVAPEGPK